MGVKAADETYTYTTGDGTWITENVERLYQSTSFSFLHKKNNSSSNVATTYTELRVYASHSMEVFPTLPGKIITAIEVTTGSSTYGTAMGGATILAGTNSASATAVTGISTVNGSVVTFDLSGVTGCEYVKFTLSAQSRTLSWKVTYTSGSSTPTVATPAFSPGTGNYLTTQNVTITTATEGATIRYTANGAEPTESSTEYTTPIAVSSTTTLIAKAFKAGMDPSAVATATYSFPVQVANIAGFLATSETGNVAISGPVTVLYQNGQNLYVQDASGTLLVYGSTGKTLVNGDQLTGLMGIRGVYGQSPQMTNPVAPDAVAGTVVNPTIFNLAAVTTADHAKYVKVENVQFVADVAYSTTSTVNGTLVAPAGFIVRDNFRLGGTFTAVKSYDIVGFINYYNGTAQLYPVTITEFVDPSTGLTSTRIDAQARAYRGKVLFEAAAGESVEIYNTIGQKLVSIKAVDGLNEVPVNAAGVLVVKVSNRVSKVIL